MKATTSMLAVGLVLASAPVADAAPETMRGCSPSGSRTLAQNSVTRVFEIRVRPERYGPVTGSTLARYACRRSVGRAVLIGFDECTSGGAVETEGGAVGFQLAGRYLAYEESWCNDFWFWDRLKVVDMRTGRLHRRLNPLPRATDPQITRVVLTPRGTVAWSAAGTIEFDDDRDNEDWVRIAKADGPPGSSRTILDQSVDGNPGLEGEIDARTLRLSRDTRTIEWKRGGRPRSAPIR